VTGGLTAKSVQSTLFASSVSFFFGHDFLLFCSVVELVAFDCGLQVGD